MSVPKPTYELPLEIYKACETLSEPLFHQHVRNLIDAFGHCEKGNQTYRRLLWLCLFASRRAIPCWQLYCDTRKPQQTIEALENYLIQGIEVPDWKLFAKAAEPSFRGRPIVDCRYCDTSEASGAVASSVSFLISGNPDDARQCIAEADEAFGQSPLQEYDDFGRWITEFAIPIAYHEREMTREEQNAYRAYDPDEITPEE
jgi:hypothetical protein